MVYFMGNWISKFLDLKHRNETVKYYSSRMYEIIIYGGYL